MRNLTIRVSALALIVLTAVIVGIANPPGQGEPRESMQLIPRTWDDQAIATLEVPLADASASPVPVSADYYYRIPIRPIYKTYPVYHPAKEPPGYFERLHAHDPEVVPSDFARFRRHDEWVRAGEVVFDTPTDYDISGGPAQFRDGATKCRRSRPCGIADPSSTAAPWQRLEDWFDTRRVRDDYVPTGFKRNGVKTRAVKGHEFGLGLSQADKVALIAFLKTL